MGNSYQYIGRYAEKLGMAPHTACLKVMSETEKVLNLILNGKEGAKAGKEEVWSAPNAEAQAA